MTDDVSIFVLIWLWFQGASFGLCSTHSLFQISLSISHLFQFLHSSCCMSMHKCLRFIPTLIIDIWSNKWVWRLIFLSIYTFELAVRFHVTECRHCTFHHVSWQRCICHIIVQLACKLLIHLLKFVHYLKKLLNSYYFLTLLLNYCLLNYLIYWEHIGTKFIKIRVKYLFVLMFTIRIIRKVGAFFLMT